MDSDLLAISLFGRIQIAPARSTAPIEVSQSSKLLLSYLLFQPNRLCPREQLMDVFWRSHSSVRARKCLNTAVWRLRRQLEPDGVHRGAYLLTSDADGVGFNWNSGYWFDVESFEKRLWPILHKPLDTIGSEDVQTMEQALKLYQGELLPGVYEDWVLCERERLRRLYLNSLAHLMRYYAHCDAHEKSLIYGHRILVLDPLREEVHRAIMRSYMQSGRRSRAIRQYERCRSILVHELGVEPMTETQELHRRIIAQTGARPAHGFTQTGPANCQEALHELHRAMQHFDEARLRLEHATRLVEQFSSSSVG